MVEGVRAAVVAVVLAVAEIQVEVDVVSSLSCPVSPILSLPSSIRPQSFADPTLVPSGGGCGGGCGG